MKYDRKHFLEISSNGTKHLSRRNRSNLVLVNTAPELEWTQTRLPRRKRETVPCLGRGIRRQERRCQLRLTKAQAVHLLAIGCNLRVRHSLAPAMLPDNSKHRCRELTTFGSPHRVRTAISRRAQ
jgi:hypothetical protein